MLEILPEELILQVSTRREKQQHLNRMENRNGRKNFIIKLQLGDVFTAQIETELAKKPPVGFGHSGWSKVEVINVYVFI